MASSPPPSPPPGPEKLENKMRTGPYEPIISKADLLEVLGQEGPEVTPPSNYIRGRGWVAGPIWEDLHYYLAQNPAFAPLVKSEFGLACAQEILHICMFVVDYDPASKIFHMCGLTKKGGAEMRRHWKLDHTVVKCYYKNEDDPEDKSDLVANHYFWVEASRQTQKNLHILTRDRYIDEYIKSFGWQKAMFRFEGFPGLSEHPYFHGKAQLLSLNLGTDFTRPKNLNNQISSLAPAMRKPSTPKKAQKAPKPAPLAAPDRDKNLVPKPDAELRKALKIWASEYYLMGKRKGALTGGPRTQKIARLDRDYPGWRHVDSDRPVEAGGHLYECTHSKDEAFPVGDGCVMCWHSLPRDWQHDKAPAVERPAPISEE